MNTEALLREALQELVRLKRLKASFEAINCKARGAPGRQRAAMRRAYLEQKPIAWANAEAALAHPQESAGVVTVTTNQHGECVAVTRTDEEGRILKVIWERTASAHSSDLRAKIDAAISQEPR